jgi:hypothetical protein
MMHYFLGLEIWQRTDDIFLSQGKYTMDTGDIEDVRYDRVQIHAYTVSFLSWEILHIFCLECGCYLMFTLPGT